MKRLITTLVILLVVIVTGMTALVLLVNPNDFRAYMIRQVELRSGYQLALEGNLRWHVWPQLSILSGPIKLTAQGASQPVVSADNMRLDVNLLPLLSHQLSVSQVLLKGAVVRLIPESQRQRPADAPVGPSTSMPGSIAEDVTRGWKFDISHVQIVDSLLVWQQSSGEQVNVRDFNLQLDQTQPRRAALQWSSRISRDQRELRLNMSSELDITDYPRQINARIQQFDYQLTGADLPPAGIKGQASMNARWNGINQHFSLNDVQLSANDSTLKGDVSGSLGGRPRVDIMVSAQQLNLDSLLGISGTTTANAPQQHQRGARAPVISDLPAHGNADSALNELDGNIDIDTSRLRWRGVDMDNVRLQAQSSQGVITLSTLAGKVGGGDFSLPGTVDVRGARAKVKLQPVFSHMDVASLLRFFALPEAISGSLSAKGDFNGEGLSVEDVERRWQGNAELDLSGVQIAALNFQQLVQRAVESSSDKVRGARQEQVAFQSVQGKAVLKNGVVSFSDLKGESQNIVFSAGGDVDLANKQVDMDFGVRVPGGWQGDSELIKRLQQTAVPLRIYGPWQAINYNLKVDRILRNQLRDEAKQRIKEWTEKNPNDKAADDLKSVIKGL